MPKCKLRKSVRQTSISEPEEIEVSIKRACELRKPLLRATASTKRKEILFDAFSAYEKSWRKKLEVIQDADEASESARESRKERSLKVWEVLQTIGLSVREAAHSVGVKAGYFSKTVDKHERVALSERSVQHLEDLVKHKAKALLQYVFQMKAVPVALDEACVGPSADITDVTRSRLESSVVNALASTMTGQPQNINLPKGSVASQFGLEMILIRCS